MQKVDEAMKAIFVNNDARPEHLRALVWNKSKALRYVDFFCANNGIVRANVLDYFAKIPGFVVGRTRQEERGRRDFYNK